MLSALTTGTLKTKLNFSIRAANSSPKIFAATAPRFDNAADHTDLKGAPWFQAGLPREISLEVLSRQSPGAFLVRQSSTKPGCFALSLRVPPPAPKVAHYLILKTQRGYKIKVGARKLDYACLQIKICRFFTKINFLLAGFHQRIHHTACPNHPSLGHARTAARAAGFATAAEHYSAAPPFGRL